MIISESSDFESSNFKREFYLELTRKNEIKIIIKKVLLSINFASESHLA